MESGAIFAPAALRTLPGCEASCTERLYTPPHQIDDLQFRQRDERLMREVVKFARPPRNFLARMCARPLILARNIATPNYELLQFLELARMIGRPPLITEWPQDWFTPAVNASKRALGVLSIHVGTDRQGNARIRRRKIVSFGEAGRHRLCDLACFGGTPFVEFHHELLRVVCGDAVRSGVMDATSFYEGNSPRSRYERLFALCACFGAAADSFPLAGPEQAFTETVVLPAFDATKDRFGATPAVVRLLPADRETDSWWESYPPEALPVAQKIPRQ